MSSPLRKIVISSAYVVGSYLLAWILIYSIVLGFDYSYFGRYFVLAWRGGGEMPATIQMLSFLATAFFVLAGLGIFLYRSKNRRR